MVQFAFLLMINLSLVTIIIYLRKRRIHSNWIATIGKIELLMLALAWGAFSIMYGLFLSFDALERGTVPLQTMTDGLKVVLTLMPCGIAFFYFFLYVIRMFLVNKRE